MPRAAAASLTEIVRDTALLISNVYLLNIVKPLPRGHYTGFLQKGKVFLRAQAALQLGFLGSLETLLATASKRFLVWKSQSITNSGLSKFLPTNFPAPFPALSRTVGSRFQPEILCLVFTRGYPRISWQRVEVVLSASFDTGIEAFRYRWKTSRVFLGWAGNALSHIQLARISFGLTVSPG
jgi:hypothetical protein